MESKAGAQISRKSFIQSAVILLILMVLAGVLTQVIPAGQYQRIESEGRELIDPDSYLEIPQPDYPIWRWFTAPIEVLGSEDGLTVITILIFLLMVGAAFAVLEKSGILRFVLGGLVGRYRERKYLLLAIISLFFMSLGAFFGIFEEIVPLVPLIVALSYSLGWDSLIGLGMSVLATNMGFSAAITNPFTLGVAQKIAGLPLFSGAALRVGVFLAFYALLMLFLVNYARRIDRQPETSPVFEEEHRKRPKAALSTESQDFDPRLRRGIIWFLIFVILILLVLLMGPLVPALSEFALPLVGVLFLLGGIGAGSLSGAGGRLTRQAVVEGLLGISPGIPLILMAVSIKHIVTSGGILDTILFRASGIFEGSNTLLAVILIFALTLVIEFFVASGSAKAFLLIPILVPLADLIGITRQTVVQAYAFGDGFSNLAYPTNPVLLIALGLTVVSYPKWIRWTLRLWVWVLLLAILILAIAVGLKYGPF